MPGRTGGPGKWAHHRTGTAPAGHRNRRRTGRHPPGTRRTADTSPPDLYTPARPTRPRLRTPICQPSCHPSRTRRICTRQTVRPGMPSCTRTRQGARTRRPPPESITLGGSATEPTSGRRRPLADGVPHAYCLGCLRDPESRAADLGSPSRTSVALTIDPCQVSQQTNDEIHLAGATGAASRPTGHRRDRLAAATARSLMTSRP